MWDKTASGRTHPNIQWFKEAKFGLFIHWGLYSELAGTWKGKKYYGSGEWLMLQGRIPASEYAQAAQDFNPVDFNADQWTQLARDAGIRYMVITAKHHEGFAMFDSKWSDFTIVKSTPYKKDPMKALAEAARRRGIQFGFYYSQFLDWHEPNGGGNKWDFDETKKDYARYYREKSVPQLKELLTNYGPLGIVWFDMPGGLTREQTQRLVDSLRQLQPGCLFSSRVGQGLGDYRDFGDSEVPPAPIADTWESIYTFNDSWGYIDHDMNFKSPAEIISLLANVASKGGNLMLNIGPDGKGDIPPYCAKFLLAVGKWLTRNGESIYATTSGFIPAQPWGVTTAKPGKLYLHILTPPRHDELVVPDVNVDVGRIHMLGATQGLAWHRNGRDIVLQAPALDRDNPDNVIVIEYKGKPQGYDEQAPLTVSTAFDANPLEAVFVRTKGNANCKSITFSHYYGDWKHATCIAGMQGPGDSAVFGMRVLEPGDYKVILEYACVAESGMQEGVVTVGDKDHYFRTLRTSEYDKHSPFLFIRHPVTIISVTKPGIYPLTVRPAREGKELFKLKSVILEPIR
jgi:alpha-L-fucosidase